MVSVGSTDTYNFLPTDMKDYFYSSIDGSIEDH
jgi:hypothetical protein